MTPPHDAKSYKKKSQEASLKKIQSCTMKTIAISSILMMNLRVREKKTKANPKALTVRKDTKRMKKKRTKKQRAGDLKG